MRRPRKDINNPEIGLNRIMTKYTVEDDAGDHGQAEKYRADELEFRQKLNGATPATYLLQKSTKRGLATFLQKC